MRPDSLARARSVVRSRVLRPRRSRRASQSRSPAAREIRGRPHRIIAHAAFQRSRMAPCSDRGRDTWLAQDGLAGMALVVARRNVLTPRRRGAEAAKHPADDPTAATDLEITAGRWGSRAAVSSLVFCARAGMTFRSCNPCDQWHVAVGLREIPEIAVLD